MKTNLRQLNFDGMTGLGMEAFWTGLTRFTRLGAEGRNMKADEGDLFGQFTFHALSGGPVLSTAFGLQKHFTSIYPW